MAPSERPPELDAQVERPLQRRDHLEVWYAIKPREMLKEQPSGAIAVLRPLEQGVGFLLDVEEEKPVGLLDGSRHQESSLNQRGGPNGFAGNGHHDDGVAGVVVGLYGRQFR